MSFTFLCARCRKVLDHPGGIILGIPLPSGVTGEDIVTSRYVCADCMPAVDAVISAGKAEGPSGA